MDGVLGEIRLWAASFEPSNWLFCDGRLLSVQDYSVLFLLLGTRYGGDGTNTFALPDLRGRVPIGLVQEQPSYSDGAYGGEEEVTLAADEMPAHRHLVQVNSQTGTVAQPGAAYPAGSSANKIYGEAGTAVMTTTSETGATAAHDNMMPYLVSPYVICVNGLFPRQN
jgi:microcystin-dependent protein